MDWADGVLEKEGRATSFHDTVGDFGDFEVGGERFGDDLEFVFGFESVQEVLVIAVGHRCCLILRGWGSGRVFRPGFRADHLY